MAHFRHPDDRVAVLAWKLKLKCMCVKPEGRSTHAVCIFTRAGWVSDIDCLAGGGERKHTHAQVALVPSLQLVH